MTISTPTAAAFKQRYRAFTSVDDALVDLVIGEGVNAVTDDWAPADQQPGVLAYAAHLLALDGHVEVIGPVSSVEVGDVKTTFSQMTQVRFNFKDSTDCGLTDTVYGRHYLYLRRRNVADVVVV